MYNEDRDHIIVNTMEMIRDKVLEKYKINIDELFDDDLMDKIDSLYEPYSLGWRNYN